MAFYRILLLLFISFFFPSGLLSGQDKRPFFEALPSGLPNTSIRSILRDSKGYMWFGTSDGLVRYDGTNFYVYENDPDNKNSINHSLINAIVEDDANNLWVGTPLGLNLYDRERDRFINIPIHPNDPAVTEYVYALYADHNGHLWIGTLGNGVIIHDRKNNTFEYYPYNPADDNSISSNDVTRIGTDPWNNIWVGTRNGLNLFSSSGKNFKRFFFKTDHKPGFCDNHITSLVTDRQGNFWVATRGGLYEINQRNNNFVFKHYGNDPGNSGTLSNNVILSLCVDKNDFLWIGTENGGLNCMRISDRSITRYCNEEGNPYSISGNSIWSLYSDEEAILWAGVYGKGINVLNRKSRKFDLYQRNPFAKNGLPDNDVRGFAEDDNGNVWIATDGGGLCQFNPETQRFTKTINRSGSSGNITSNAVMAVLYDSKKNLWIGTWSGGVDRLSKTGKMIKNYPIRGNQEIGNNNVISLYEDRHGNIWAGSAGSGLFRYDRVLDKFEQVSTANPSAPSDKAYVSSLLEDENGILWVGTYYGLVSLKRIQGKTYEGNVLYHTKEPGSISSSVIEVIYQDSKHKLWIGTCDNGLNLLNNNGTFTVFQKRNGLPGKAIRSIMEDNNGNLWISTNKGLAKFDTGSGTFRDFTTDDGLNGAEFYPGSSLRTRSGEFYVGGKNGFNAFYPDRVIDNTYIPPVCITNLKINNKPVCIGAKGSPLQKHISATTSITLSPGQTSFTIDFAALNYTDPSRNQYVYKLEGFDSDWNYAGTNQMATYTNIDPGNYRFLVKGSNNDDVWNPTPASLDITVNPPLWKTSWARLSYVIVILSFVLLVFRVRSERIQVKNQLKLERMAREKEHELTQLKMQFFTNISHEFRTPLSLILSPLENLITTSDPGIRDQLSVTYRNARRMMRLVNELMDFRKLDEGKAKLKVEPVDIGSFVSTIAQSFKEAARKRNITFTIDSGSGCGTGWIDKDKMETVISNLLGNAFKFVNDNGQVSITVTMEDNNTGDTIIGENNHWFRLTVADNGIGIRGDELPFIFEKFYQAKSAEIKKTSGTGIGLALTKGFVELHHGSIAVESIPNERTCFTVRIPVAKHIYNESECVPADTAVSEQEFTTDAPQDAGEENIPGEEKAHILVVEDNDELRNYLANELSKNFTVTCAADGQQGAETAFHNTPDLIVSDIVMPGKSGIELCSELKADVRTSHIPVVLLTAKTTVDDQIEGIGRGADAYLPKPFNVRLLKTQIRQLIESRRKLYAHFSHDVYLTPANITENEIDQTFLQKIINHIIDHSTDPQLNVEALADVFNMSRSQVYRKIKALTGKTAVEFIRTVRLKQALKLMESRLYTLAEIAYKTGFTSPSYFTKSFKEQYGKTPSEYLEGTDTPLKREPVLGVNR